MNVSRWVRSDDALMAWLTRGGLSNVESLVLWNGRISNVGARALAGCSDAAGLRALDLSWNRIGPEGVRALAESPWLTGLQSLRLYHNDAGPQGAEAIAAGSWDLAALNLCGNGIGVAGARALARGRATPSVRSLHLGWVHLGDAGIECLAARSWEALTELNVRDNGITAAGARAIGSGAFPRLHRLGVDDNPLDRRAIARLRRAIASVNAVGCAPAEVA